jgi:hypothetical protein
MHVLKYELIKSLDPGSTNAQPRKSRRLGQPVVVLHEAAKLGHLLVESQRKPPLLAKNARNGAPGSRHTPKAVCTLCKYSVILGAKVRIARISESTVNGLEITVIYVDLEAGSGESSRRGVPSRMRDASTGKVSRS